MQELNGHLGPHTHTHTQTHTEDGDLLNRCECACLRESGNVYILRGVNIEVSSLFVT